MLKQLSPFHSSKNVNKLVFIITMLSIGVSIILVYALKSALGSVYNLSSFIASVSVPFLIVPPSIYMILNLSTRLEKYKENLKIEIEKNKKKDLMLFEQARFVLMGEMMANISHQWKQPLNNVGLAIVSSRFSASEEEREKNFDIMEENIKYLSNTINDFMSFFEKKSPNEARELGDILDEVQSIMKAQIESCDIKLTLKIAENLKHIKIIPVISQVLLNLLSNAKDAKDDSQVDKEIILYIKAIAKGIQISCCDNGVGIEKSVRSKVFDPYFTTKAKKQGTGIGLYMSKQIVNSIFNGEIIVDEMSKNTCFRVNIPYSDSCQVKTTSVEELV